MRHKHPTKIRLTQEEALELQQEVGLALAKATKKLLDEIIKDFTAYSERVKQNVESTFLRRVRKSRKRESSTISLTDLEQSGKVDDVLATMDSGLVALLEDHGEETLRKLIDFLPERHERVINMVLEGKTLQEIGQIMAAPPSTIARYRNKAIRHMRQVAYDMTGR